MLILISDILKSRHGFAVDFNVLEKHIERAHPNAAVAVQRLIYHQPLKRFAVRRLTQYKIFIALVVAVSARLKLTAHIYEADVEVCAAVGILTFLGV